MNKPQNFSKKSFAIYGLGLTGKSVIKFLKKQSVSNYVAWDDLKKNRDQFKKKNISNFFLKSLNTVDYIIISPGIDIKKTKFKKIILKNKHKIITDLDLFYLLNKKCKTVVVTGTNGKSTTCKLLEHVLKKNKINVKLGGNIGKPILSLNINKKTIVIIEASSFQLHYSKFIKPKYAMILNITKDHLDWHGSMQNYLNSKLKIFLFQDKNDYAFLADKNLINKFNNRNSSSKLKVVNIFLSNKIKKQIINRYLKSKSNEKNISFVYKFCQVLKIKENLIIKSLNTFQGLPHRHEIFYKFKNFTFINDSKATSFEASKFALESNSNIFWIVGGLPKLGDQFFLKKLKGNIIKSYIIGKNISFFKKQLKNKINYTTAKNLKKAISLIFVELKKNQNKKINILLSPASASYDQYKNFNERGNEFKKLIKTYVQKYF
ncbi:UDP-N-acetylmuramoyl-L-alanine--D-glutamate ligase [Pelagibacteraceae bacterium]|nr:UDP-N-acetylmuramoyl-L-alanine--D-glutamate ligase [Pelagibacteraceae bacterium]